MSTREAVRRRDIHNHSMGTWDGLEDILHLGSSPIIKHGLYLGLEPSTRNRSLWDADRNEIAAKRGENQFVCFKCKQQPSHNS